MIKNSSLDPYLEVILEQTFELQSRRRFLKTAGATAAGLWGLAGCGRSSARQPNIVLVMSDDMGFADIGCYGSEVDTPNLNRLAANGLRYTQFYNTARCCPTRACLLTGLYPHQAGVGHMMNDRGVDGYRGDLNQNCVTIAQVLKPAGYSTYMSGKYHVTPFHNNDSKHNWPLQRGFDRFFGTIHGAGSYYDPCSLARDNEFITPGDGFYYTNAISDNAVQYIREHETKNPFFMYVAYTAAHWPNQALPEDIGKYKGRYDGGWEKLRAERFQRLKDMGLVNKNWQLSEPDRRVKDWDTTGDKDWHARCMEVYAAMIDCMDQGIGRIVQALEEKGELENTLIFFLQDNGACAEQFGMWGDPTPKTPPNKRKPMASGELQKDMVPKYTRDGRAVRRGHGVMPGPADTYVGYATGWAHAGNTPFRMYKHWIHEGGIATPLIVHWPRRIRDKNALRHQPGHLVDIMATCVDVAGADYPDTLNTNPVIPMQGKSLVPTFANRELDRDMLCWEHEGNRAIRVGKWKLVSKPGRKPRDLSGIEVLLPDQWELFDLEADRTETNNLASDHSERVRDMAARWLEWAKRTRVVPMHGN